MIAAAEFSSQIANATNQQNQTGFEQPQDSTALGGGGDSQVYDFQALVNAGSDASAVGAGGAVSAISNGQPMTLGDAILKGMLDMKNKLDTGFQELGKSNQPSVIGADGEVSYETNSPADLIKLQVQAIDLGFQLQLSGQIVNKSTQDIEMFLKAQ